MYCPECSEYIPQGLGLTACPKCHLDLSEVQERIAIAKEKKKQLIQVQERLEIENQNRLQGITRFNPIQMLALCFFSKKAYDDVVKNWTGGCLFFLLLASFVIIPSFGLQKSDDPFSLRDYQVIREHLLQQIPDMQWSSGVMKMNVPSPHYLKMKDGSVIAAFDTSGQLKSLNDIPAKLLLTENAYFFRKSEFEVQNGFFPNEFSFLLNRSLAEKIVSFLEIMVTFWVLPTIWIGIWLLYVFVAAVYCLINRMIAFFFKLNLGWAALFRLSAISSFPSLVLEAYGLAPFIKVEGLLDLLTWFLPLIYSLIYLMALKREQKKEARLAEL